MNVNAIIVADQNRLAAFPYHPNVFGEVPQISWNGVVYSQPQYAAEWMELLNANNELVGVRLDLVRDLHPAYWLWLRRFSNVTFDERGDAKIFFRAAQGAQKVCGPFLPVEAFLAGNGDFALYVPELFCAV